MKAFIKIHHNRKGFTIVELVIVIAVIAILAAVLIPTFTGIIEKANISKASSQAINAYKALTYNAGNSGGSIRDGFVFINDDYAFTNIEQNVHQLELVGTNSIGTNDYNVVPFMLGDITYNGRKTGIGAYELKSGDYSVYKLDNPSGSGTYFFWVQLKTDSDSSFQQKGFEWIEDADTYSVAMIFTEDSTNDIISRYKIKTTTEASQNGVMIDNNGIYSPIDSLYVEDSNFKIDFSQVDSFTVILTGGDRISYVEYNDTTILSNVGSDTISFNASDLLSHFIPTDYNNNWLIINYQ